MSAVAAIWTSHALKRWVKLALPLLPAALQRKLRDAAGRRRLADARSRRQRTHFSIEDSARALDRLGLSGDLMIHSSILNIGKLKDGTPADLVRQVMSRLDLSAVTLLAPALPFNASMKEYMDRCTGFDVRSAPNAMGAMANVLMHQPGCLRSLHPSHSVIALGARAAQYVEGHENDPTPFGPNSPFAKLTRNGGKILMFGVGLNSVTSNHVYEDMLGTMVPFDVYLAPRYEVPCVDRSGQRVVVRTYCHAPFLAARRDCERARKSLERGGHLRTERIGESEISLLDARGHTVTLLEMLLEGDSIYGPVSLSAAQAAKVSKCLSELR